MGKPSAPKPTPPKETSAAATGTNVSTAIANAILGNVNQRTPTGTLTWRQRGTKSIFDPYTQQTYDIPRYTSIQRLSPQQQKIQTAQDAASLNLSNLAKDQSSFLQGYLSEPFKYDTGEHEKWSLGLYDKLNAEKEAQRTEALKSQLANSGVKLGSDAYGKAMDTETKSQLDARNQFLLDSLNQGFGMAQAQRTQPINEITALMSGGQVSQPQWINANMPRIPTTDNAGIIANYDQQKLQQWQQQMANWNNMMGGLFSLGSAFISDKRAKKDIEPLGKIPIMGDDGKEKTTGLFAYNYKGEKGHKPRHIGVMAQDLEKVKPSAVLTLGSGLKAVDYSKVI